MSLGTHSTAMHDRREEISELFHAVNQPLTTLCCSLELSLYKQGSVEQYRECIEQALEQAGRLADLLRAMRELWDAEDSGEIQCEVRLDTEIQEIARDLQPVAETRGVALSCRCAAALPVLAEPQRMHQGLFYVLEWALNLAQAGTELEIAAEPHQGMALLALTSSAENGRPGAGAGADVPEKSAERSSETINLPLMIARRIFEAAGGTFQISRHGNLVSFQLRLPLCGKRG